MTRVELKMHFIAIEADDGNRTRLPSLGSWCSTDELHLHMP